MPRILPRRYYEHATVGRAALTALHVSLAQIAAGLTRTAFLAAQLDAAATLEIVTLVAAKNLSHPGKKWWWTFTQVPGFCWVIPAVCMLGAYPCAYDVAKLASRFHALESSSLPVYRSHRRKGEDVLHIKGTSKPAHYQPEDCLQDLGGVVGSQYPPPPPGPPHDHDRQPLTHPFRRAQVPPAPRQGVSATPNRSP